MKSTWLQLRNTVRVIVIHYLIFLLQYNEFQLNIGATVTWFRLEVTSSWEFGINLPYFQFRILDATQLKTFAI